MSAYKRAYKIWLDSLPILSKLFIIYIAVLSFFIFCVIIKSDRFSKVVSELVNRTHGVKTSQLNVTVYSAVELKSFNTTYQVLVDKILEEKSFKSSKTMEIQKKFVKTNMLKSFREILRKKQKQTNKKKNMKLVLFELINMKKTRKKLESVKGRSKRSSDFFEETNVDEFSKSRSYVYIPSTYFGYQCFFKAYFWLLITKRQISIHFKFLL